MTLVTYFLDWHPRKWEGGYLQPASLSHNYFCPLHALCLLSDKWPGSLTYAQGQASFFIIITKHFLSC